MLLLETDTRRVAEWHILNPDPAPPATQTAWRTETLAALAVGPVDLLAGDIIDARLHHEFDNENDGAGHWTINGQKSEHWSLWAMASTSVRVSQTINPATGAYVIPPQEQNWDWLIHHFGVSRSGVYKVPADLPQAYIYDRVYFKSSMSYTRPEEQHRRIQINGVPYCKLSVTVHRG